MLKKTHLFGFHKQYGRLVEFAGFEHALWYEGIAEEHMAVREAVGAFDVTHMGRMVVEGRDAVKFLEMILPRRISDLSMNQGKYTFFLNEGGGVVDDLTVFRLGEERFLIVYNATNRVKDYEWVRGKARAYDVTVSDVSDNVVQVAVQGPRALAALQTTCAEDLSSIRRYRGGWVRLGEFEVLATRSGYTGEDGFELFLWGVALDEPQRAEKFWATILEAGREHGIKPCGLGARDTLRLEAGMCLYGNDLDESTTPLEANLERFVDLDKEAFIGREALLRQKQEGVKRSRVGVRLLRGGVPRKGCEIYVDGTRIGALTSGTFSPLLKVGIGMGYVDVDYAKVGTDLLVKIRESLMRATVVEMPFYDTTKYGFRRKV